MRYIALATFSYNDKIIKENTIFESLALKLSDDSINYLLYNGLIKIITKEEELKLNKNKINSKTKKEVKDETKKEVKLEKQKTAKKRVKKSDGK